MAWQLVDLVLGAVDDLGAAKITLVVIAERCHARTEACYPSELDIARRCGRCVRSVDADIELIVAKGWMAVEKRIGRSTIYRPNFGRMRAAQAIKKARQRAPHPGKQLPTLPRQTVAGVSAAHPGKQLPTHPGKSAALTPANSCRTPRQTVADEPVVTVVQPVVEPAAPEPALTTQVSASAESQNRLIEKLARQKQPSTRRPALLSQTEQAEFGNPGTSDARRQVLRELHAERERAWDAQAPARANGAKP